MGCMCTHQLGNFTDDNSRRLHTGYTKENHIKENQIDAVDSGSSSNGRNWIDWLTDGFICRIYVQCGAWTHHPEIKSHMLHWASQVPLDFIFLINELKCQQVQDLVFGKLQLLKNKTLQTSKGQMKVSVIFNKTIFKYSLGDYRKLLKKYNQDPWVA